MSRQNWKDLWLSKIWQIWLSTISSSKRGWDLRCEKLGYNENEKELQKRWEPWVRFQLGHSN